MYFPKLFVLLVGLIIGSFLSALTYRFPRGKSVVFGRSSCPNCKNTISWYDNIPLFSYLFLKGKCRQCGKKISFRYPAIELGTAIIFLILANSLQNCPDLIERNIVCEYKKMLFSSSLPFLLLIASFFITSLIIDLEHKIILDKLTFVPLVITFLILLLFSPATLYLRLLAAFAASSFLLLLNLTTAGRGMGEGDVKFGLLGGLILGWPITLTWLYLSFVIGAFAGLLLIIFQKAKFGKPIPFGPFLAASFFIAFLWGENLRGIFFNYLSF